MQFRVPGAFVSIALIAVWAPPCTAQSPSAPLPPAVASRVPVPAAFSLPPLPAGLRLAAGRSGWHRSLPEDLPDRGQWSNLPDGHRVWRLALRSPGAVSLRLRMASLDFRNGRLFVYSAVNPAEAAEYRGPLTGVFWTPVLPGETLVVEFVPQEPFDPALPFRLETLAHEAPAATPDLVSCPADASCRPEWLSSAQAVFRLQAETPAGSRKCAGFLIQGPGENLLLTRHSCVPDAAAAATLAIRWNGPGEDCDAAPSPVAPFQTVGATLLDSSNDPAQGFALLALSRVPAGASSLAKASLPGGGGTEILTLAQRSGNLPGTPWLSAPGVVVGMHDGVAANACPVGAMLPAVPLPLLPARLRSTLEAQALPAVKQKAPPRPPSPPSAPRLAAPCVVTPINIGQTVNSQLTTADCLSPLRDVPAKRYTFTGAAGQQVFIRLTSPTMDTYLILLGPGGNIVAEDDDGAGNLNSQIPTLGGFFSLPQTGIYTIEASIYREEPLGVFTLELVGNNPQQIPGPFRFVPVTPCRVADTRPGTGTSGSFGPPHLGAASTRNLPIPASNCGIPATARAYSLNVTVVPKGPLAYLTIWPGGYQQPLVSTLNSFEGRIVANAAIVPAGADGSVTVFVTDPTDVIVDINGYFVP